MLDALVDALLQSGWQTASVLRTEYPKAFPILSVRRNDSEREWRFLVVRRDRPPYPGELGQLKLPAATKDTGALLSTTFVSANLGEQLVRGGWSWVDDAGNCVLSAKGLLVERRVGRPTRRQPRTLPAGSGSWSIIRRLIVTPGKITTSELAKGAGVSQPRASQVLGNLAAQGLVQRVGRAWTVDRALLLDRFLAEYPGPGEAVECYYSLDPPNDVAAALARRAMRDRRIRYAVSGDVAADLLAPHRRPTHLVIYTAGSLPITGWQRAEGRDDANIILRGPTDLSMLQGEYHGHFGQQTIRLAHPTQVLWDLRDLGGSDREEAEERLRAWLLGNR